MGGSYTHIRINYNNSNQSDIRHTLPASHSAPTINPSDTSTTSPTSHTSTALPTSHTSETSATSHVTFKSPGTGLDIDYTQTFPTSNSTSLPSVTSHRSPILHATSYSPYSAASQQVTNFIHYHERGSNSYRSFKPSYDINQAATKISRENAAWNSKDVLGRGIEVTYSFHDWGEGECAGFK